MQPCCLCAESWTVCGLCGTPVTQRGLSSLTVGQPVRDGEPGVSLQLRQNHEHLPERGKMYMIMSLPQKTSLPILVDPGAQAKKLTNLHLWITAQPKIICEPVQRRDAVDGFEAAARGHHVEAVAAVT